MPAQRKRRPRIGQLVRPIARELLLRYLGRDTSPRPSFSAQTPHMNALDLKGRGAVITGGAAGIGFAIAQRLAASGARLSLWDRDSAALQGAARTLATDVHTAQVDVADEVQVQRA